MDNNYLPDADPHPKRRRDKDNPYELFTIGIATDHPRYFVKFMDGQKQRHCEEISKDLYELLDSFEREDVSHLNERDRHYERFDLTETSLHRRAAAPMDPLQEIVEAANEREQLHKAISMLTDTQQKRIRMYYFEEMKYEEIAGLEGCAISSVEDSLEKAKEKLVNILKTLKK